MKTSARGITLRMLYETVCSTISAHEQDLIKIHEVYQTNQIDYSLMLLNQPFQILNESEFKLLELKEYVFQDSLMDLKKTLMRLFYESGFRVDVFEFDVELMDKIIDLDESLSLHELLVAIFYMAMSDISEWMIHIFEGRFLLARKRLKEKLNHPDMRMDYEIMSIYQKALNRLFNIAQDKEIAMKSYQTLNRLIKKERPLKPSAAFNGNDHRIICPSCKNELSYQHQTYCMFCGQKLANNKEGNLI
ncbi:hypothetical protein N7548_00130 [Acholeplasma manati]|uniref:Zinc ribbon domain-containing protein n=1 Tax=Paracholeplasma manati TaxID=591373 RepID=A0ABT2Y3B4_9MOLU|nr:hypothetical protein [Paracholeplasma manati]MCV2231232.1 hypothetical protein [Paracholeplasma manati]